MARSTYFDRGRIADACPGSESGYAQRFQCGNVVRRLIWTRMTDYRDQFSGGLVDPCRARFLWVCAQMLNHHIWFLLSVVPSFRQRPRTADSGLERVI